MSRVLEINDLEGIQVQIAKGGLVLIEFGASWCAPCRAFLPHFTSFAAERPEVTCVKVDVDVDPLVVSTYGIQTVPQVKLYSGGRFVRDVEARTIMQLRKEF